MQIEKRINTLATETERKISREELTHIQKDIESEFGTLKKLMDIKEKADKKRKVRVNDVIITFKNNVIISVSHRFKELCNDYVMVTSLTVKGKMGSYWYSGQLHQLQR